MSDTFDLTENIKFNKEIIYDYPSTTIYTNEIKNDNGVFQAPVTSNIDDNFYYTSDGKTSQFNFTKIHIGKVYHDNITAVTENNSKIVGELVLEHSPNCYTCFFLEKSFSPNKNVLESLLARDSATVEIELNDIIGKQDKCIHYNDGGKQVFLFTTPIYTSSNLKDVPSDISNLFTKKYDNNYTVIPGNYIGKRDDDQIYIDCSPTGASEEELNTYNVPINTRLLNEKQQTELMVMSTNFALFAVLSLVGYFLIPVFYKKIVIDSILYMNPGSDEQTNIKRLKEIATADIALIIFAVVGIMTLYTVGMTKDPKFTSFSLILSLISILSASLITMKKSNPEFLRAVDSNGRVIQLEVPTTTIKDEITNKKTEIPVSVSATLGSVSAFIGDSFGFLVGLLPAIAAILLVAVATVGILGALGIIPDDIVALIGGGGTIFAVAGLVIFKTIEKVDKLKRGEAA